MASTTRRCGGCRSSGAVVACSAWCRDAHLSCAGATDMRKGFDGLYGLVRDQLLCDPLSGHVFLFSNAQRNRLKLLCWTGQGYGSARAN